MKKTFFYILEEQKLVVCEPKGKVLLEQQCSIEEAKLILKRDFDFPNAFEFEPSPSAPSGTE